MQWFELLDNVGWTNPQRNVVDVPPQILLEVVQAAHICRGPFANPMLVPIEYVYVLCKDYVPGLLVDLAAGEARRSEAGRVGQVVFVIGRSRRSIERVFLYCVAKFTGERVQPGPCNSLGVFE